MGEVADYVAGLDGDARAAVEHIYDLARAEVPDAEEGKSYGMAALRYRGRPLVAATAAKSHFSIFPFSPAVVDAVSGDLSDFDLAKGTIRYTADAPVPDAVVSRLVALRRDEIDRALDG